MEGELVNWVNPGDDHGDDINPEQQVDFFCKKHNAKTEITPCIGHQSVLTQLTGIWAFTLISLNPDLHPKKL